MVDTDLFAPPPAATARGRRRVVYCGALGRHEEVERALRSFAAAAVDLPDAELVLVGYGPPPREAQAESARAASSASDRG